MLLASLALSALPALASAAPAVPQPSGPARAVGEGPEWFEGSFEELMAEAARTERVVFIDFWTTWCGWCKKLDADTLSDSRVVAALGGVLCYSVDAESPSGLPLAERFAASTYPALRFLDPDGEPRDAISGYLPPTAFLEELARIRRDEGTIGSLRRAVAARSDDLRARYELASKLGTFGDEAGRKEQIQAIWRIDPQARRLPTRRFKLDRLIAGAEKTLELDELRAFLELESDGEILFRGWVASANLALRAGGEGPPREALALAVDDFRHAWDHVPAERVAGFGNRLAWFLFESRQDLDQPDLDFAVRVAGAAHRAEPESPEILDTLACSHFAAGDREEALRLLEKGVRMAPDAAWWAERRELFGG